LTEFENIEPCLVETSQGFSVKYKEKFLYSKYNPAKAICQKISELQILPGTLFLGFSPVLSYGVKEFCEKLPENCLLLLCEADKTLWNFENKEVPEEENEKIIRLTPGELFNLPVIIQKNTYTFECGKTVEVAGNFRRVIRLDFSAGVQFHNDFYNTLERACVASVKQFWTNRFTLAKFGRKYSRNMFSNLKMLPDTKPLSFYIKKINRPLYVFGAGEGAEKGIEVLKQGQYGKKEKPFVLCADTAFSMLKGQGIIPDGIVIDEAQSIIAQSFIGVKKTAMEEGVQVFQSLCSLPHVAGKSFPADKITFYATEYASNQFFDSLKTNDFFPPVVPAFGSVGITAYILACLFRENENIPVYSYGLDFAYSTGKTHGRGTPAHKRQLRNTDRVKSIENFASCFGENVIKVSERNDLPWTTPILASYAQTYRQVQEQSSQIVAGILNTGKNEDNYSKNESFEKEINLYLISEKASLEELRDLLSGKISVEETERTNRVKKLLENRQYLFLHFPDGYKLSMELNFLKRVRSEIDGFLKIMEN